MKGKQLLLLLVLVVVAGGASWFLQKGSRSSWSETGAGAGGKVVNLPINDIARIAIKASDGEVNLVKKNDTWTVQERADYPAAFEKVSDLLRKVWDLKTVQEVKVGASQLARLELLPPAKDATGTGTLIDFQDKDGKRLQALLLGKKFLRKGGEEMGGGFPVGRYVMPVGDKAKVSLVSDAFEDAAIKPEAWLKKDFIKIENPLSITLAGPTEAQHWKLTRENSSADWKLAEAKPEEQLDTAKTGSFGSAFSNPSFNDVMAPAAKPEETGLDKPAVLTLATADHFTYTLKVGKLVGEYYPMTIEVSAELPKERPPTKDEKPEDKTKLDDAFKATQKQLEEKLASEKKFEGRTYLVGKFTVDSLIKDRTALLAEKKPEPAAPAPPGGQPEAATPPVTLPMPVPPAPPAPAPAPTSPPPPPAEKPATQN